MTSIYNYIKRITRLLANYINLILTAYLSRMTKWLLHRLSGKSRLERCILARESSANKVQNIGKRK